MDNIAYEMHYDSILDFQRAAVLVEAEIQCHGICNNSSKAVPGMNGRRHHDMWVSLKAVSHFNLGTSLELMLKLLLLKNNIPIKEWKPSECHKLTILYNAIPEPQQKQLESTYRADIPQMTSKFVEMVPWPDLQGNSIPFAAIR